MAARRKRVACRSYPAEEEEFILPEHQTILYYTNELSFDQRQLCVEHQELFRDTQQIRRTKKRSSGRVCSVSLSLHFW